MSPPWGQSPPRAGESAGKVDPPEVHWPWSAEPSRGGADSIRVVLRGHRENLIARQPLGLRVGKVRSVTDEVALRPNRLSLRTLSRPQA